MGSAIDITLKSILGKLTHFTLQGIWKLNLPTDLITAIFRDHLTKTVESVEKYAFKKHFKKFNNPKYKQPGYKSTGRWNHFINRKRNQLHEETAKGFVTNTS